MNNQTKIIIIGLLIIFLGLFSYIYVTNFINQFENENVTPKLDNNKLIIIVSTHHLYELTKEIGGEKIFLIKLIPDGVEPHDWEPMSEDILTINQADLLFHNGLGLEPWIKNFSNNEKLKIINVSEDIPKSMIIKIENKYDDELDSHTTDPHVWLDPILVKYQVNKIKSTLMTFDSENKDLYNSNGNLYIQKLDKLDEYIKTELSVCSNDKNLFITLHQSFNYFSKRYELNSISLRGLHHHQEPNPNDILKIISIAKNNNITKIYIEPNFNPDLGKTIVEEIDGELLVLDPFETGEKDYMTIMMSNIANLKRGFNCD